MILPGDQPDYQTSDDDDTLSSSSTNSDHRSPTSLHLPPPVSVSTRTQRSPHQQQQQQQQVRTRPAPFQPSLSSTSTRTPVAPPRKASFEWIPTPLPTPQSRRALAHDNPQQRSGQHQLRTEKQTASSTATSSHPNSALPPSSSSTSPPTNSSSFQRTPSFSTPQRPTRPTASPFMSDLPLYSPRTTGPLKQQQQQSTSNTNSHDYNNNPHSHAAHSGDVEMQERSQDQQRQQRQQPSVARSSSLHHSKNSNDTYTLPTPSPSSTADNPSSDLSPSRDDSTLDRSLSTNPSGSSGANDGGRRRDRDTGGRTTITAAVHHPTQNSRSNNRNASNHSSSASRSSSIRVANHIDPSTGQRQELRGDSTSGGISSFFGGLFKGGKSNKSKQPAIATNAASRTRKKKDTVGGLPASASGSKNDLIDRSQLQHHPSGEKLSGSAFVQQDPSSRKKGLPGKDGREPETDMFNFVDTMLDMPVNPTWSQVIVKLLKVLVVMCVCYFGLMALYFGAEVSTYPLFFNHYSSIPLSTLDRSILTSNN